MSKKPRPPEAADDARRPPEPAGEEPGSNAVDHEPDPRAKPIPGAEHKYIPRSPYTSGND